MPPTEPRILPDHGTSSVWDQRAAKRGAVVALSGGQDSATCLAYALRRFRRVSAVTFDYGQRHAVELDAARSVFARLTAAEPHAAEHVFIDVPAFEQMGDAALTNPAIAVEAQASPPPDDAGAANTFAADRALPSTFVPGRNLILLGLAAAYGLPRGHDVVVTGVCAQDRAGYPDCRVEFILSLADTIRYGTATPEFAFDAPLLNRDKAQTWQLADDLGIVDLIVDETHTCYQGDHEHRHAWGYGCGECPACDERRWGYERWVAGRGATTPA